MAQARTEVATSKVTRNVAQYPLHHVTYPSTKFEVAMSNGLGGDTFTRNVTDAQMYRRTDVQKYTLFFLNKKADIIICSKLLVNWTYTTVYVLCCDISNVHPLWQHTELSLMKTVLIIHSYNVCSGARQAPQHG